MTIIQARELALQGKTVISPSGKEYEIDEFEEYDYTFSRSDIFGEWREKKEPRRIFKIESEGVIMAGCWYNTKPPLELTAVERIVEFVEVVP